MTAAAAGEGDSPAVQLQFLHSPAVMQPGAPPHVLSALDAALLAHLALQGPTPRALLAGVLWPDRPQGKALANLRKRLQVLRRIAPDLLTDSAGPVALTARVRHDLQDPATALLQDPEALTGALLGALDYSGMTELDAWLSRERTRWAAQVREALVQAAVHHEAQGRIAMALRHAVRLVRDEPTHEHGVRLLMRLHHRRGDRGAALLAYERCVAALHEQFGEAVSDETASLAQAIAGSGADAPAPLPLMPLPLRHPPRLVGRARVLAAAQQRWQDGGLVLLAGPAGIGKSRLFEALCLQLPVSLVLRLHAEDASTGLGLARRLVQQLALQVPAPGVAAGQAAGWPPVAEGAPALAQRLAELLAAAASGPLLGIGIEDLHFADPESLEMLLANLPVGTRQSGLRWLFSSRHRPFPAALEAWLGRRPEHDDALVEVAEFDISELAEYIGSLAGEDIDTLAWSTALHAHCGGNPLHVLQVLRAVHELGQFGPAQPPERLPQPAEVRERIGRRLDRSDPVTQQLAFVAALAGVDFDVPLAQRVLQRSAAELTVPWRQLEGLGLFHAGRFSHELTRQAVLQCVPAMLVPQLRGDIAAAMLGTSDDVLERRACHWEAAGEPARAAQDHARAAELTRALGLPVRARALLAQAVRCHVEAGDAAAAFELRWHSGRLALACASAAEALAVAAELLASAVNDRQRCLAHCLRAQALVEQHDAAALQDAERAASFAAGLDDLPLLQQVRLRQATALNLVGRWQEALDILEGLAEPGLQPEEAWERVETRLSVLSSLGRRREAVAQALDLRDRALAQGHWQKAAEMASTASVQYGYLSRPFDVIAQGEQALALLQRAGVEQGYRHVDEMTLAGAYLDVGRFDDAVRVGEMAAAGLRTAGLTGWIVNADNSLAGMYMLLGRFDLAAQRLRDLPPDAPMWARASRRVMQGVLQRRSTGESPLRQLQQAWSMFEEGGALLNPFIRHRVALELATCRPPAEALAEIAACEAWARSQQHVALARVALRWRIDTLLQAGRPAAAAAAADALEADFDGQWQICNLYLPEVWRSMAQAWDATAQQARADAAVARALAWVRSCEPHVPPVFLDSFWRHNPVNRWLRQRAGEASDHASITLDA